jgi:hypothetical protein
MRLGVDPAGVRAEPAQSAYAAWLSVCPDLRAIARLGHLDWLEALEASSPLRAMDEVAEFAALDTDTAGAASRGKCSDTYCRPADRARLTIIANPTAIAVPPSTT